jgi:hypothetical protein
MHHRDDTEHEAQAERSEELFAGAASQLFDRSEVESVLSGSFYAPPEPARRAKKPKAEHYKVICISMYTDDLEQLDGMIEALKKRGLTKANRSALIRWALTQLDLEAVPRGL